MEKIIYCCDVCGKEILNYDKAKDQIRLPIEIQEGSQPELAGEKFEVRDVCLHCLSSLVTVAFKVQGHKASKAFIELLDDRKEELQK